MNFEQRIATFANILEDQQRAEFAAAYPGDNLRERMDAACKVKVHCGKKWARVDVGTSGKYMVDMTTEEIVGIKAYGVPHLGHRYGTLATINAWDWSGYQARPKA